MKVLKWYTCVRSTLATIARPLGIFSKEKYVSSTPATFMVCTTVLEHALQVLSKVCTKLMVSSPLTIWNIGKSIYFFSSVHEWFWIVVLWTSWSGHFYHDDLPKGDRIPYTIRPNDVRPKGNRTKDSKTKLFKDMSTSAECCNSLLRLGIFVVTFLPIFLNSFVLLRLLAGFWSNGFRLIRVYNSYLYVFHGHIVALREAHVESVLLLNFAVVKSKLCGAWFFGD